MKLTKKQQANLNKTFKANKVKLAYLFGSQANGRTSALSDIDIGVLLDEKVRESRYFDSQLKLMSALSGIFKKDEIDVVILNKDQPLLNYNAVVKGKPIFVTDQNLKNDFHFKVLGSFEDFKYYYEEQFRTLERHLKNGTFGKPIIKNTYVSYQ